MIHKLIFLTCIFNASEALKVLSKSHFFNFLCFCIPVCFLCFSPLLCFCPKFVKTKTHSTNPKLANFTPKELYIESFGIFFLPSKILYFWIKMQCHRPQCINIGYNAHALADQIACYPCLTNII